MELYQAFEETSTSKGSLTKYELSSDKWEEIKGYLKNHALSCYLKDGDFEYFNSLPSKAKKVNYLKEYFFPDDPTIMSGDFGEILSYYFIISQGKNNSVEILGPKKWQDKDGNNSPVPHSDVLLYTKFDVNSPKPTDCLITVEAKMAATRPLKNRIQAAVNGAFKDRESRMLKTILWLERKYMRSKEVDKQNEIKRFKDPVTHPYEKTNYAIAIIDTDFVDEQLGKPLDTKNGIEIYVLSVNDLKSMYQQFFSEVLNEC